MVVAYKKKINTFVGLYFLINIGIVAYVFMNLDQITKGHPLSPLVNLVAHASFASLIYGLYNYAKAKGYSGWLALLGFLQIIGLIILVVLPDKRKNG